MVTILGAGLSGCLAGVVIPEATILEAKDEDEFLKSPEHKAVLRFRTPNISQIAGIKFEEVQVRKSIWYEGKEYRLPDIRFTNMYSRKVADGYFDRSIVNLDTVKRWIAPEDFHVRMLKKCNGRVKFGCRIAELDKDYILIRREGADHDSPMKRQGPIISTIAMPIMAKILHIESPVSFQAGKKVYVYRYRVTRSNLNVSMYYPSPDTPVYRASVMRDLLSIEMVEDQLRIAADTDGEAVNRFISEVLSSLGIDHRDVEYLDEGAQLGKISYNVDERLRKNWVYRLTAERWIYSLGRFAIWKNILQDDVYNDVLKIRGYIESGTHYDFYREAAKA